MTNPNRGLANVCYFWSIIDSVRQISLFFQLQVGPINDGDSFDTDRLSGSLVYDDDDIDDPRGPGMAIISNDPNMPLAEPMTQYATVRNDDQRSRKKDVKDHDRLIEFEMHT